MAAVVDLALSAYLIIYLLLAVAVVVIMLVAAVMVVLVAVLVMERELAEAVTHPLLHQVKATTEVQLPELVHLHMLVVAVGELVV
jgi:hypothetical protein